MNTTPGPLLPDKVAIVTGGGGGIGQGIAIALAQQTATVVIAEMDQKRAADTVSIIQENGGSALAVVGDIRERDVVQRVVATTLEEFGHIDVLVNNIGHTVGERNHFHETDEEEWLELYSTNFLHVLRFCKAVIPSMIDREQGGSIINVSSIEAFRGIPFRSVYGAFKAAVANFTKSLALDLAEWKIRVNDIAPDVIRTLQIPYETFQTEEELAKVRYFVPMARLGDPSDAGGVAVFLASDLSSFVTGHSILLDGGTYAASGWYRSDDPIRTWTCRPLYDADRA